MQHVRDKLIVALDVDNRKQALALVSMLGDLVSAFKVGSQLFTAEGPGLVREIVARGSRVFLDLKYHDIPNTVAAAAVAASRLGVFMLNLHASGGREMMKRTVESVAACSAKESRAAPLIIAVTVLTSIDSVALSEIGITNHAVPQVTKLALLAEESGVDGVVSSPREVDVIRSKIDKPGFVIVTPGVRRADTASHDQKRTATPGEAIKAGATYIVVGRPITSATNPVDETAQVLTEMEAAASD